MSLSKWQSFSEAELDALGLWDVAEQFGKKRSATSKQAKKPKTVLTVDEIEKMQKQAYDEAFAQGLEEGVKQGKNKGFEEGKAEGIKKGYEEKVDLLRKQSAEFVSLLESLSEPFKLLDETVEKELVNLTIAIASQLIRREIKIDSGQIIAVIREAVNALPVAAQQLTVKMHPKDAELVRSTLAIDELSVPWNIIEDLLITRGGCKVETESSNIDATVENKLATIIATVLGGERVKDNS
ncbi:MAG: flagellar assembly protein FliH [Methylococcales bacterium]|nr:flagellar assembly protein FliH [Methylococcales bacterium]